MEKPSKVRQHHRKEELEMPSETIFARLGVLAELARQARLGRTAFMKILFFLQESRGVPLDYQFSLYSYGPFDSDVLSDISSAERLNVLKSTTIYYPSGIGYEYSRGTGADSLEGLAEDFVKAHQGDIKWALDHFSRKTAAELELLSTILYIAKYQNPKTVDKLIEQVELVKPHFSQDQVRGGFNELVGLNVLRPQAA
jgi:uncharacterized protein